MLEWCCKRDRHRKETALTEYPCRRKGKHGWYICGHCATIKAVLGGTRYIVDGRVLSTEEAVAHCRELCSKNREREKKDERVVVKEIRRDGQRILKVGVNVYVQLKRKKGTARSEGYVVECYENDSVRVHVNGMGTTVVVPADEFVIGRQGMTSKAA